MVCYIQDLAEVGSKLQQEGKKRKLPELQEFASWIVDSEAPKLQSKEQVRKENVGCFNISALSWSWHRWFCSLDFSLS
jgi:hypothetical protein